MPEAVCRVGWFVFGEGLSDKNPLKLFFLSRQIKYLITFSLCLGLIFLSQFFHMKNKNDVNYV